MREQTDIENKEYYKREEVAKKFAEEVFDDKREKLLTIDEWSKHVIFDRERGFFPARSDETYAIRSQYTRRLFPIITHEFLVDLVEYTKQFKCVCDLACGTGQLTHWIKKYKGNIEFAIDNKSWDAHGWFDYYNFVKKEDSVEFVKNHPQIDLYLLSWPYMDPMAFNIWQNMKVGQTLLYIGEDYGGCTADDDFFMAVQKFEIDIDLNRNFRAFCGIHDRIKIFKKENV